MFPRGGVLGISRWAETPGWRPKTSLSWLENASGFPSGKLEEVAVWASLLGLLSSLGWEEENEWMEILNHSGWFSQSIKSVIWTWFLFYLRRHFGSFSRGFFSSEIEWLISGLHVPIKAFKTQPFIFRIFTKSISGFQSLVFSWGSKIAFLHLIQTIPFLWLRDWLQYFRSYHFISEWRKLLKEKVKHL